MTHQTTYLPKQTNHLLHLVLTFATCGAWGFVWAGVALWNAVAKDKVTTVTSQPSAWYGQPVARPYEVGPGAPVGPMNPAASVPPPGMPPIPLQEGLEATRQRDGNQMWSWGDQHPMPPYVGNAPGWPTNMARRQPLEPFQDDQGLMTCGLLGCGYQTHLGPKMAQHRATPHQPASPQ